jgi:hypothetical protein
MKETFKNAKPVESEAEYMEVRKSIAEMTAVRLGISIGQSYRRVDAFLEVKEKLMKQFKAENNEMMYAVIVDIAMQIPQI